jgi:RNA polymerase sigma factor (sigma-70 family)
MPREPSRLRELMDEARTGSQEAAREIVALYSEALLRVIRRKLHPRLRSVYEPHDVLQSAWKALFSKALQKLATIEDPTHLVRYLVRLVKNKALRANRDWLDVQTRSLKREAHATKSKGMERLVRAAPEDPAAEEARLEEELEERLKGQPPETQELVRLYRHGIHLAAIARHLKLSERTVRRRLQDLLGGADIPDCLGTDDPDC